MSIGLPLVSAILLTSLSSWRTQGQVTINPTAPVNATFNSSMDTSTRDLLLELHNDFRREEREASNMNRLDWSDFLEQQAAQWVAGCNFKHQVAPPWGENLYRSTFKTTPDNTISNALMAWHLEQYNIHPSAQGIDCCDGSKKTCCHYTQMIWAATEYLGCAITQCPFLKGDSPEFDYSDALFMACYYYPPGNVIKQQPYHTGKDHCTDCSVTNPDCDRGLCFFDNKRC